MSLSFPDSCVGVTAEVAAQETAHNWGLEHTDVQAGPDVPVRRRRQLVPRRVHGHLARPAAASRSARTCHELYCPQGQGEQQNSHAELLGVFGPREADTVAPEILSVVAGQTARLFIGRASRSWSRPTSPTTSNMIGVKWTWLEGLPPDFAEDWLLAAAPPDVCNDNYAAWRPIGTRARRGTSSSASPSRRPSTYTLPRSR